MKRAMFVAVASAALLAGPALAKPPVTREMAKEHDDLMFRIADANHDGVLTHAELETYLTQMGADPAAHARAEEKFEQVDTVHAGSVTLKQFENEELARFDRADTNHDGVLDDQERLAAKAAIAAGMTPGAPPPAPAGQ